MKKAGKAVGIEYNIGTHSARKTFGMLSRMIHPNDYNSMELLQSIYNHSEANVTKRYIGLTKKEIDTYYDDMGTFFDDYITGDKVYEDMGEKPIISIDANDLRDIVKSAYELGRENASKDNISDHLEAINQLLGMVDTLKK